MPMTRLISARATVSVFLFGRESRTANLVRWSMMTRMIFQCALM